jgi:hypothetical protein
LRIVMFFVSHFFHLLFTLESFVISRPKFHLRNHRSLDCRSTTNFLSGRKRKIPRVAPRDVTKKPKQLIKLTHPCTESSRMALNARRQGRLRTRMRDAKRCTGGPFPTAPRSFAEENFLGARYVVAGNTRSQSLLRKTCGYE